MVVPVDFILAQAQQGPGFGSMLLFIVPMFIIMYLLMIKPQQKKQKEHQEMVKKLKVGDKVVTSGGIHGVIAAVKPDTLLVKVSDTTKLELSRGSVALVKSSGDEADDKKN